jgi:hypothetical protein
MYIHHFLKMISQRGNQEEGGVFQNIRKFMFNE